MNTCQRSSSRIFTQVTSRQRWLAFAVFLVIGGIFVFLLAGARGWVDSVSLLGVCGFRQRTGLPCLGCYWTRAGQAFVTGHILRSFYIQPAAAASCGVAVAIAFFALLSSLFGVQFVFLNRFRSKRFIWKAAAVGGGLVFAAWILEVIRTILEVEVV